MIIQFLAIEEHKVRIADAGALTPSRQQNGDWNNLFHKLFAGIAVQRRSQVREDRLLVIRGELQREAARQRDRHLHTRLPVFAIEFHIARADLKRIGFKMDGVVFPRGLVQLDDNLKGIGAFI